MKRFYSFTHPSLHDGEVLFSFCNGYLYGYELKATDEVQETFVRALLERLPLTESELKDFSTNPKAKLKEVQPDLRFEVFWEKYDYKIGNKPRAKRLWDGLKVSDRLKAVEFIPRYNAILAERGTARLYPETYLSQRRFDVR